MTVAVHSRICGLVFVQRTPVAVARLVTVTRTPAPCPRAHQVRPSCEPSRWSALLLGDTVLTNDPIKVVEDEYGKQHHLETVELHIEPDSIGGQAAWKTSRRLRRDRNRARPGIELRLFSSLRRP